MSRRQSLPGVVPGLWINFGSRHLRGRWRCGIVSKLILLCVLVSSCSPASDGAPSEGAIAGKPRICRAQPANTESGLQSLARCFLRANATTDSVAMPSETHLYVDLSGSMAGFLDPDYSTNEHDFGSVLDTIFLRLGPSKVFGYGRGLRDLSSPQGMLGQLGKRQLYTENQTRIDLAIKQIALDSMLALTHVIIGDGRRDTPDQARQQFGEMVELANAWVAKGGTFFVAVSRAPFRTVQNDPSGCRRTRTISAREQRCPLYSFGFIPPGEVSRVVPLFAAAFEDIFVWPMPADLGVEVLPDSGVVSDPLARPAFLPRWVSFGPSGTISRFKSTGVMKRHQPLHFEAFDVDHGAVDWHRAVLSRSSYEIKAYSVGLGQMLDGKSVTLRWRPYDLSPKTGLVHLDRDDSAGRQLSARAIGKDGSPTLVKFELVARPAPLWMGEYSAANVRDPIRTFGLHLLFVGLLDPISAPRPAAYLLIN